VDNAVKMTNKRCPQGSAKNVLLFVERCFTNKELLRWLGFNPFASIKTFLTRTKFNQQRSTGPRKPLRFILIAINKQA
ncbi:hypothetical protein, partial [Shewanella sp.]|uniref:hypothetical protein n=1 Tax=Shewanella sp. TaxID=50422 RepID=UPI0040474836